MRHARSLFLAVVASLWLAGGLRPADAAGQAPLAAVLVHVSGTITASDGHAIVGAKIELSGNGAPRVAVSAAGGRFTFSGVRPGTYAISARAPGYTPVDGRTVDVAADGSTDLQLALARQQASSLTVIGSVKVNNSQTISTSAGPTLDIAAKPYAQQGETRTSDILSDQLSTTVYPVIGGGLNAPAVVALRGPDPSETLVDVDGHQVNNGSTGDFDLSLLDPADLQSIQVLYGIAPSSLFGPNTLGGALNVRTLEPTTQPQFLERLSAGSYGTYGATLQATGTVDRLGYAVSLHRLTSAGELSDFELPTAGAGSAEQPVGNGIGATSTIAKLHYALGNGSGFVGFTFRDQAVERDVSATLSAIEPASLSTPTTYDNFSGSTVDSSNRAYGIDLQLPLGRPNAEGVVPTSILFRHQSSLTNQSVTGPGAGTSPYLYNDRDAVGDDTLEIDRTLPRGTLSLKYALTTESLLTSFIPGVVYADSDLRQAATDVRLPSLPAEASRFPAAGAIAGVPDSSNEALAQTERSLGIRYAVDPTSKLHYSFATYFSDYSTFGRSDDPRFGFVWTPTAATAVRVSVGSTFQSPQLPTFIVPPTLPAPVDGYISIGNPNATAERATAYDLGYEHTLHVIAHPVHFSADLYRTDLHNGVAAYFAPPVAGGTCSTQTPCLTYPVNVTQEIYEGAELRADVQMTLKSKVQLAYDVDSVYTKGYPSTSADNVPLGEQSLGVPLHKFLVSYDYDPGTLGLAYSAGLQYEGSYNELNLGPYATLRAGVTYHARHFDIGVYGTNLTNAYDFKFAQVGGGIPYGGLAPNGPLGGSGPEPTTALPLAGRQITLTITNHM